jgi:hypothetical protein
MFVAFEKKARDIFAENTDFKKSEAAAKIDQ